jgi:hypothetical protein
MYTPFLMLGKNYFSDKVGGGDNGVATGIVRDITIMDGHIIVIIPLGIEIFLMIGDIITVIISGVVGPGILLTSITVDLTTIGGVVIGVMTMDGDIVAVEQVDMVVVAYTAVEQVDMVVVAYTVVEKVDMVVVMVAA